MSGIEVFVILAVASFDFTIVSGSKRTDQFVADAEFIQALFKKSWVVLPVFSCETLGKLRTVIRLNTVYRQRKTPYQMLEESCRSEGVMGIKSFDISPPGILVNGCILEEFFADSLTCKAGCRNILYVDLYTFAGVMHLLIWLGNVLRVWRFHSHDTLAAKDPVKSGDRTRITALHELYPEDNKTGMRISSAHVRNELQFLRRVLIGVMMRAAGTVSERLNRTVIALLPAVNILTVDLVSDCGL